MTNLEPVNYFILHYISNQIKSLLLSHHHSTSALVSEILMSVLQTVQKNNRQFTYGQTVQKKQQQTIYIWTDSAKNCTGAFTVLQTVQKKQQQQQFTYGQTVQKSNSNLHMDSTYLQTVQNTMCKIHIHLTKVLTDVLLLTWLELKFKNILDPDIPSKSNTNHHSGNLK